MMTKKDIPLYEWQERCLSLWFDNACRGIVSVATGAGKTLLALTAAGRLQNSASLTGGRSVSVKIVVPRVFLARQWKSDIINSLGVPEREVGLYYGSLKSDPVLPYMVYVINSARYSISRHILADIGADKDVLLICDEAHHYGSKENARIFEYMKLVPVSRVHTLGLSATPDAEHLDDVIVPALGRIFYRYNVGEAIRQNVAASYVLFRVGVDFTLEEHDEYKSFSLAIARLIGSLYGMLGKKRMENVSGLPTLSNELISSGGVVGELARKLRDLLLRRKKVLLLAESRISCGIELVKTLIEDNRIIMFSERIATANALYEALAELYPSRVGLYHSGMETEVKRRTLEAYRTGQISVIISCRALDEGLDAPYTDIGIIVSSGAVLRQRIQRIGRIIRKTERTKPKRIFYLYVPGTSESSDLLPEEHMREVYTDGDLPSLRLSFDSQTNRIVNLPYDQIAERVTGDLLREGATDRQIENALKQIRKGALATDWLSSEQDIIERLRSAAPGERSYLSAMLLMVRAAEIDR
jgi:superfamily II DNA or RNA helicase